MLAVYLHHDNSVLTNVFCTQVLCADAVVGEEHAKNPKGIVSRDAVMLCGVPYRLIVVIPVPILCTAATICPQFGGQKNLGPLLNPSKSSIMCFTHIKK
jgi:hypothetical protein